jgi:ribosomal protein L7/L12
MSEPFLLGLIVGFVAAVVTVMRIAFGERHSHALSRLEAKLDALLKHEGIRFDAYADLPPSVVDALLAGKKIEAIKEYRAVTGAGLKEAKEYVEEVQRRAGARG